MKIQRMSQQLDLCILCVLQHSVAAVEPPFASTPPPLSLPFSPSLSLSVILTLSIDWNKFN